jgi:hypothetical protein
VKNIGFRGKFRSGATILRSRTPIDNKHVIPSFIQRKGNTFHFKPTFDNVITIPESNTVGFYIVIPPVPWCDLRPHQLPLKFKNTRLLTTTCTTITNAANWFMTRSTFAKNEQNKQPK